MQLIGFVLMLAFMSTLGQLAGCLPVPRLGHVPFGPHPVLAALVPTPRHHGPHRHHGHHLRLVAADRDTRLSLGPHLTVVTDDRGDTDVRLGPEADGIRVRVDEHGRESVNLGGVVQVTTDERGGAKVRIGDLAVDVQGDDGRRAEAD